MFLAHTILGTMHMFGNLIEVSRILGRITFIVIAIHMFTSIYLTIVKLRKVKLITLRIICYFGLEELQDF